jgi:predicted metalloprotease with PDZ domain
MKHTRLIAAGVLASALTLVAVTASANMAPPEDFILGFSVAPSADGPRVTGLEKGSPAERAGVRNGDILLGADGRYTKAVPGAELDAYLKKPKWRADLIVVHDGTVIELVRVYR